MSRIEAETLATLFTSGFPPDVELDRAVAAVHRAAQAVGATPDEVDDVLAMLGLSEVLVTT